MTLEFWTLGSAGVSHKTLTLAKGPYSHYLNSLQSERFFGNENGSNDTVPHKINMTIK